MPGRIRTHDLKSFAPQACALPLGYNRSQDHGGLLSENVKNYHSMINIHEKFEWEKPKVNFITAVLQVFVMV